MHNGYIETLENIFYAFLSGTFLPTESDDRQMRNVTDFYSVNDDQVKVLAYLVHFHDSMISREKILTIQDSENDSVKEDSITDLCQRNFIKVIPRPDKKICYSIDEKAYSAFMDEEKYGEKKALTCIEELSDVTLKQILEENWTDNFYKLAESDENTQIRDAIRDLNLRRMESSLQDAFWILARQFVNCFTKPFIFSVGVLSDINYDESKLKSSMGSLVKLGLAISIAVETSSDDSKEDGWFALSRKTVETLFRGHNELIRYDEISQTTDIILVKDIVKKDLYFTDKSQEEIDNLRKLLKKDVYSRAMEILTRKKRNPGIQSLFWGPPGTGKTETIKQLARESGRDLLIFNAAKVTNSLWGATEKMYRSLFLGYSYIAAISDNPPILVLNEADQVLSHRLSEMRHSLDKSENVVSNILLQEFEDMSGILMATTNLISNLDEAFDRRFLFKTELTNPDVQTRRKIWKSLIPELTDEETYKLAERFDMSGGQISNVAAKRDLAELYLNGDRGFDYIAGLCSSETEKHMKKTSRRIGY